MSNNQQPGWPQQPNQQQPHQQQPHPEHGGAYPPVPQAPGQEEQAQQFPPYGQQPGQEEQAQQFPPYGQQPGPEGQAQQFPPYGQQPGPEGQAFHGDPGQQYGNPYGQPGAPMYAPPPPQKKGMPLWGWIAGGAGALVVIAVVGIMVFNILFLGRQPVVVPEPTASESATAEEAALPEVVYLHDETDFRSAPVWSVRAPEGWAMETVKEGTVKYTNSESKCVFTVFQAALPHTGETEDGAATRYAMTQEINTVKKTVGGSVDVVDETGSTYVKLRDGSTEIELQEAELRFKNNNNADVVYRMAVRATASSDGLMELGLACPGGMSDESVLWSELVDRITMTDAP